MTGKENRNGGHGSQMGKEDGTGKETFRSQTACTDTVFLRDLTVNHSCVGLYIRACHPPFSRVTPALSSPTAEWEGRAGA